jgi:PAS domain S-box-containing protein
MTIAPHFPGRAQAFVWHFMLFLVPVSIVLIISILLHYKLHIEAEHKTLEKTDLLNVRLAQITVNNVLQDIVSDIKYLQEHNQTLNGFINTPRARKILAEDFFSFSKNKKIYDQIRYLNLDGNEIVRVNYNNGQPVIVKEEKLQKKDNRYYVAKTITLNKDEIYWSPFDLNIENNQIEIPYKPTIRIGTPVYNSYGRRSGVLILNFDGEKLINEFKIVTANIANHIMLVNNSGYWLINPTAQDEWGFMFSNNQTFANKYPRIWNEILLNDKLTQQYIDKNLLTYASIFSNTFGEKQAVPTNKESNNFSHDVYFWKIIAFAPPSLMNPFRNEFIKRNAFLYSFIFLILVLSALLLARLQINTQKAEAQSEYERGFRNILESMELIAITLNRNARVIFCNQSFIKLSGFSKEEILQNNWFVSFVEEKERRLRQEKFAHSFDSGINSGQGEGEVVIKDGSKRLIGWRSTLSFDSKDKPVSITYIGTDITEQRHIENELRKASQAIEQSPNTIMITDTRGHIVYTNPKFTELTGYSKEEVMGKNPRFLQSGDKTAIEYAQLWTNLKNGTEWIGEFHNRKKNGELYWEAARISTIKDNDGKIIYFLAVKEDITEKKQLEAEVELRNKKIAKNEVLAGVGEMATMIAHDLRNPLSSIKMGMQILQKQTSDMLINNSLNNSLNSPLSFPKQNEQYEEEIELIQIGLEQVHYMESILSDLMSFSRPEQLNPEWISIEKILDASLITIRKQLDDYKIEIDTNYQTGLPTIFADKIKLRQVFSNLILNAVQATEHSLAEKAVVSISVILKLTDIGPQMEIQIADNGVGINRDIQDKLFEPFFTTRAKGTGLGLAIVMRIIEQHRGSIELKSEDEQGTIVTINLPITPPTETKG